MRRDVFAKADPTLSESTEYVLSGKTIVQRKSVLIMKNGLWATTAVIDVLISHVKDATGMTASAWKAMCGLTENVCRIKSAINAQKTKNGAIVETLATTSARTQKCFVPINATPVATARMVT